MNIYAIVFKDTGELITPRVIREHWPHYGDNSLYGWRPPKKIYDTIGRAKAGFAHLPEKVKDLLSIMEFVPQREIITGPDLRVEQDARRELKVNQGLMARRRREKERLEELARKEYGKENVR